MDGLNPDAARDLSLPTRPTLPVAAAGEWMRFILRRDSWLPSPRYKCATAVNGQEGNTCENALRRGHIQTPPRATGLD